jgi:hypothetical protein
MQQIVNTSANGEYLNAEGDNSFDFNEYLSAVGVGEDAEIVEDEDGDDSEDGFLDAKGKKKKKKKGKFWQILAAVATGGVSLTATKDGRKALGKAGKAVAWVVKQSVFRVPLMSFIGLLRINFLGMAARMWAGAISKQEAEKKGLDMKNWERAQKAVKKVEKALRKMGFGDKDIKTLFYPAIIKGHDKPPFRSRKKAKADKDKAKKMADAAAAKKAGKVKSFDGEDEYLLFEGEWFSVEGIWEAAAIAAGSAVIGIVADLLKKSKVNKNPYADGQPHDGVPQEDMLADYSGASPEQQAAATKEIIKNDTNLTPEQKQEMLAEVDENTKYLNEKAKNPSSLLEGEDETQKYLIYGGIAIVGMALFYAMIKILSPKSK